MKNLQACGGPRDSSLASFLLCSRSCSRAAAHRRSRCRRPRRARRGRHVLGVHARVLPARLSDVAGADGHDLRGVRRHAAARTATAASGPMRSIPRSRSAFLIRPRAASTLCRRTSTPTRWPPGASPTTRRRWVSSAPSREDVRPVRSRSLRRRDPDGDGRSRRERRGLHGVGRVCRRAQLPRGRLRARSRARRSVREP